ATPYQITALEARNLAMEARNRETAFRLHASEFANFLDTFAWELGGTTDAPAWLTTEEVQAQREAALARVDAARDATLAAGEDETQALREQIPALEASANEAVQAYRDAKAAINTAPPAQREPLYARLKAARAASRDANIALRDATRAAKVSEHARLLRANRATTAAPRQVSASKPTGAT